MSKNTTKRKGASASKKTASPEPTAHETWEKINQGISDTMQHFCLFTNKLRDDSFINNRVLAMMDAKYDDRDGAEPLTDGQLRALGGRMSAEGNPEAVILLMDEIERSRNLPMRLADIAYCVIQGAGEHTPEPSPGSRVQQRIRSAPVLKRLISLS